MWKYALVYGASAGAIVIGIIIGGELLSGGEGRGSSQVVGYLIMLLALTLIYFGTRRYRDVVRGGVIGFWRALLLGLAISVVAGLVYTVVWEIYFSINGLGFFDSYAQSVIAQKKAAGLSGEALAVEIAKMEALKVRYGNIWFRMPVTFSEIFPVGIIVSLVSGLMLRTSGLSGRKRV